MFADPKPFFAVKARAYDRYVSAFLYPQGFRAFFERAAWLGAGLHILDAGCGSGIPGMALLDALARRGLEAERVQGFDLTPEMIARFREKLVRRGIAGVDLREADVLEPDMLPPSWANYDLIISASMLEYIPKDKLPSVLGSLGARLAPGGRLVVFITRRNPVTALLVERPWGGNRYSRRELAEAFATAGFAETTFHRFPFDFPWLNLWGHIVEGRQPAG